MNRSDERFCRIDDFSRKPKRFGNARIKLSVDCVVGRIIFAGIAKDDTDLAFSHNADVLHANFGAHRDSHVVTDSHHNKNAMPRQINIFDFTELYTVDFNRVVQSQGADLRKSQIIGVKNFTGILVVQKEQAKNQNDNGEQDNKADSEI